MNHIFTANKSFPVPDGTWVAPLLGPNVSEGGRTIWMDGFNMARGEIPAGIHSKIHVHPVVTQVTWVQSGKLTVKMKDPHSGEPYELNLTSGQAVLTEPGTFFQLVNSSKESCHVLYIVHPAFLFEVNAKGDVTYNDAIVLEEDWKSLAQKNWRIPQLANVETIKARRSAAAERLKTTSFSVTLF